MTTKSGLLAAFRAWLLHTGTPEHKGFYEEEQTVEQHHHTEPWWKVMCLTGVDYFSTLGYQPGIAALAASTLAPLATSVLVLITLFGALPMYHRVAEESPHGDGSLSMLERLLAYWPSKLLVLSLLGFVATGFVITITLSAADATAHLVENPYLTHYLEGTQVPLTLGLITLLGVVFMIGFSEAIGVAVVLVAIYLVLSLIVVGNGVQYMITHPETLTNWWAALNTQFTSPLNMVMAALVVFPALALGLSGFETGVVVMPLVKGSPDDSKTKPLGRIRNAKKLLTTAAVIMSFMLMGSSFVTITQIQHKEFWPATSLSTRVNLHDLQQGKASVDMPLDRPQGQQANEVVGVLLPAGRTGSYEHTVVHKKESIPLQIKVTPNNEVADVEVTKSAGRANGRALAFIAHERLGDGFGTAYDISTILILWFAGASAMAGLLNIVPRYLPRYGMAPDWARTVRPLVLVFSTVCAVVTILFKANVDAQAGAYATGVLALMTSAAIAVFLTEWRRGHKPAAALFGVISAIFVYTSVVTIAQRPEGLYIALLFIVLIMFISITSRVTRSVELRTNQVILDDAAREVLAEADEYPGPLRFIANKLHEGDEEEYRLKALDVRLDNHLHEGHNALFLEVEITDASEFTSAVHVTGHYVGRHGVLRATGTSVPNTIAAVLLYVQQGRDYPPHVYFEWSERPPGQNVLRFLFSGEGDIPPLTHEVLRRAQPNPALRPHVHAGG